VPLGRARTVTGLDVGTTSIKAVRLAHKRGGCRLLGLAVTDIAPPAGNASGGAKQKAPAPHDAAVSAIRAALEQSGASDERNAFVVTGMSGPGISVKHVSFPEMSTQRLAESLRWEARKHVPFSGSDFVMDFQPLPAASGADGEMQILLTAVDGAALSEHVELLGRAGVEPDTVDLVPLALMNELDEEGLLDGGALAVVDLGASIVSLAVYKRGGLFYARGRAGLGRRERRRPAERRRGPGRGPAFRRLDVGGSRSGR
jgi:Tfp pilus assembly PilM family ATPase